MVLVTDSHKKLSEVIRSGLRLLENEESKVIALKNAIQEGLNSPRVENFDFDENLESKEYEIEVIRILHERMDLKSRLTE